MQDLIRAYGYLTLGSRLRRLGERLQQDTQRIMDDDGLTIQASHYPILAALGDSGSLAVGELAEAVGVSQPAATRSLGQLVRAGLVEMRISDTDQRFRLVTLTAAGEELIAYSRAHLWPQIEAAVRDLCEEAEGPLLDQLTTIEDGLRDKPLAHRMQGRADHTTKKGKP